MREKKEEETLKKSAKRPPIGQATPIKHGLVLRK